MLLGQHEVLQQSLVGFADKNVATKMLQTPQYFKDDLSQEQFFRKKEKIADTFLKDGPKNDVFLKPILFSFSRHPVSVTNF